MKITDLEVYVLRGPDGGLLGLGFAIGLQGGGHAARATTCISTGGDGKFAGRRGRARFGSGEVDGREPRES